MSEVIVITSGKGGVGKTTTTANVGTGLAQLNKKVVLIDTDIGLRNLDVVMGLENRIVYNLVDVVEGNCRVEQALIKDKKYPNLCLLPSAQTRDKSAVSPEQMQALIEDLRQDFDYILLDCPAGIEQGFKNAIAGADRALVVTTPEVSAVRDADRIIGLILNLFIGIALGTNVVIANAIGREDEKTIHKAVHTSIIMAIVGGLIVTIIGELSIGHLLKMLNVPDDVFPYALLYIRIYLIGMPVILLTNLQQQFQIR